MSGFKDWLKNEMMGSVGSMVSCRDLNNPNFQVQGALSNLGCGRRTKTLKMRFNKDGKRRKDKS